MKKEMIGALVGNASALGVHWIYNPEFLEALSKKQSLLFMKQNQDIYDQAKPSYYVYPQSNIGDLSQQGMFLKWLYKALIKNPGLTQEQYIDLLFDYIKPGGTYVGYVESYAKKMIITQLSQDVQIPVIKYDKQDDHLVGFVPYIACKALDIPTEKAWELAQAFTHRHDYLAYYQMFDYIIKHIHHTPFKTLVKDALKYAPTHMIHTLEKAIEIDDTKAFIKGYAGIACHINQSIPLILHLLSHETSFERLMHHNAKIGGASSDRALLLGVFMSYISEIPKSWVDQTQLD